MSKRKEKENQEKRERTDRKIAKIDPKKVLDNEDGQKILINLNNRLMATQRDADKYRAENEKLIAENTKLKDDYKELSRGLSMAYNRPDFSLENDVKDDADALVDKYIKKRK